LWVYNLICDIGSVEFGWRETTRCGVVELREREREVEREGRFRRKEEKEKEGGK
jgi:hypothetical protein